MTSPSPLHPSPWRRRGAEPASNVVADLLIRSLDAEPGTPALREAARALRRDRELGRPLSRSIGELPPEGQAALRAALGETYGEWLALARGRSDEFLPEALLQLGQRTSQNGSLGRAAVIFDFLSRGERESIPASLSGRAERELALLRGAGPFGAQVESAARRFARDTLDPSLLGGMTAAAAVGSLFRASALARLAASPSRSWFTAGWGARFLASGISLAPEAGAFWATQHLIRGTLHPGAPQGDAESAFREIASLGLTLGALKLTGALPSFLPRSSVLGASAFFRGTASQAALFTGLIGAHALETRLGLRDAGPGDNIWLHSLATLLQFNVAGRLSHGLLGPEFAVGLASLNARAEVTVRRPWRLDAPPFLLQPTLASVRLEGPKGGPARPQLSLMTGREDGPSLSTGSGGGAPVPAALAPLVRGLRASVSDEVLRGLFEDVHLPPETLARYVHFKPEGYHREVVIREGEGENSFEILILSWEPGQGTVPHDHSGSTGFDKILQGEAEEITYQEGPENALREIHRQRLATSVVSRILRDDVHAVLNPEPLGKRLISLHAYRPAMDPARMRKFPFPILSRTRDSERGALSGVPSPDLSPNGTPGE